MYKHWAFFLIIVGVFCSSCTRRENESIVKKENVQGITKNMLVDLVAPVKGIDTIYLAGNEGEVGDIWNIFDKNNPNNMKCRVRITKKIDNKQVAMMVGVLFNSKNPVVVGDIAKKYSFLPPKEPSIQKKNEKDSAIASKAPQKKESLQTENKKLKEEIEKKDSAEKKEKELDALEIRYTKQMLGEQKKINLSLEKENLLLKNNNKLLTAKNNTLKEKIKAFRATEKVNNYQSEITNLHLKIAAILKEKINIKKELYFAYSSLFKVPDNNHNELIALKDKLREIIKLKGKKDDKNNKK